MFTYEKISPSCKSRGILTEFTIINLHIYYDTNDTDLVYIFTRVHAYPLLHFVLVLLTNNVLFNRHYTTCSLKKLTKQYQDRDCFAGDNGFSKINIGLMYDMNQEIYEETRKTVLKICKYLAVYHKIVTV